MPPAGRPTPRRLPAGHETRPSLHNSTICAPLPRVTSAVTRTRPPAPAPPVAPVQNRQRFGDRRPQGRSAEVPLRPAPPVVISTKPAGRVEKSLSGPPVISTKAVPGRVEKSLSCPACLPSCRSVLRPRSCSCSIIVAILHPGIAVWKPLPHPGRARPLPPLSFRPKGRGPAAEKSLSCPSLPPDHPERRRDVPPYGGVCINSVENGLRCR